ncbi:hypothetical protein Poly30_03880 [Planctomycetes bacterium Poly30]|uniref:WD domain, G-beta repeat n=1 Tax=Saltatorellus ferox TaxID=2528018 RepID=A0A518ELC7_9BACT|nr:hypothetical protein Poly30_03880 [Planctomycetes bacterium Poly30]
MQSPSPSLQGHHVPGATEAEYRETGGGRPSITSRIFRYGRRFAAVVVLLLATLYLGLLAMRWTKPEPLFEDPTAYLDASNCSVSPDGQTAYLFLQHPARLMHRDSIWAVNLATLERELLPDAALKRHPLVPCGIGCFASVVSMDGTKMLGALQIADSADFFSLDLATGAVAKSDPEEFQSEANHGGWRFERVRPLSGNGGGILRASRSNDDLAEPFMLDTHRDPAVAAADPMQVFYIASDGTVHHHDARTGADAPLGLVAEGGHGLRVSPDARWLALGVARGRAQLFEVATGRSRVFEHSIHSLAPGDRPVIHTGGIGSRSRWTLSGIEDDVELVTEAPVGQLRPVAGGRFLGLDNRTEAAYLFGSEGKVVATLREPSDQRD